MSFNRAVAAHEAAHAVCGVAVGRRVSEITLDPPDDECSGWCIFDTSIRHSPIQAMHDLYVMVSLVGGELGEALAAVADVECPTKERGIARRHCVNKLAPALGVDGEWLYALVETVARNVLTINRVQFDSLRWWLERERKLDGDQIALICAGLRTVNLTRSIICRLPHKALEPHHKTLVVAGRYAGENQSNLLSTKG